jgi:hypothetical protein
MSFWTWICCGRSRKKYLVALLGREADQRNILFHVVPDFKSDEKLRSISEHTVSMGGMDLILQSLDDSQSLYDIRKMHIKHAHALIFAVDADSKESVEACISLIKENATKTKDAILVLVQSYIHNNKDIDQVRSAFSELQHGKVEFIVYGENRCTSSIWRGFDWVCSRVEE